MENLRDRQGHNLKKIPDSLNSDQQSLKTKEVFSELLDGNCGLIGKFSSRLRRYSVEDFEERKFVGRGSYGEVCKFFHKELETVAVKRIYITGDEEAIKKKWIMVRTEANILCRFNHPNIVSIWGITTWPNAVGIVMEYVDGGNLLGFLSDPERYPTWKSRLEIAQGVMSALSYLHNYEKEKWFCHGDLKPENILLTKASQPKLSDFASAELLRATDSFSTTSDYTPTKQFSWIYAAPEVLENTKQTRSPAMDMYSFGMVLYDMITRKTPYSDCVFPQKIHGLILAGIKPSKQLVDEAETEAKSVQDKSTFFLLKTLMEVCTDNDPNLRPSSEKVEMELKSDLTQFFAFTSKSSTVNLGNGSNKKIEKASKGKDSVHEVATRKPTLDEVFVSGDRSAVVSDKQTAIHLLETYKNNLMDGNFEEANAAKSELKSIISTRTNAQAQDCIMFGILIRERKQFLESIAFFDAAAELCEKVDYPDEFLSKMERCVAGLKDTNELMAEQKPEWKAVIRTHSIPLMRDMLLIMRNKDATVAWKSLQVGYAVHYIHCSEALVSRTYYHEPELDHCITNARMQLVMSDDG